MVKIISLSAGLWDMNIHRIQFLPIYVLASLVAQMVKNMPAMRETWGSIPGFGRSPGEGHGNPLQLPGESPRTEELGGLQSMRSQRVGHD